MRSSRVGAAVLSTLVAFAILPASVFAQGPGSISEQEARDAIATAEAALAGEGAIAAAAGPAPELTMLFREIALAAPSLDGRLAARANELLARPDDKKDPESFGKEAGASPVCSAGFCVHWTAKGKSAPSSADSDNDKVPNYVEKVLDASVQVSLVEHDQLGWQRPPSDGKLGGGRETDIYIVNLGRGLFGFAQTDPKQRGPKQHSYLVLDDDYKGFDSEASPIELMQATLAHEYNHVLQFGYDLFQDVWMFESTATWIEDFVFPDVDDWINFVPAFADLPFLTLLAPDKMYGSAVFNHWLSGRYTPAVIERAWAVSRSIKGRAPRSIGAYDKAIAEFGGAGLVSEHTLFVPASVEWAAAGSVFPNAADLPEMFRDKIRAGRGYKTFLDSISYQPLTAKGIDAGDTIEVTGKTKNGVAANVWIVARVGPEVGGTLTTSSVELPKGGKASGRFTVPAGTTRLTIVAVNGEADFRGVIGAPFTVTLKKL